MADEDLYPGRVFRETTGNRHMYVILGCYPFERLMGNWSSYTDSKDATCILVPADHSAISHDSVMMYKYATPMSIQTLRKFIGDRTFLPVDDLREDVLKRIQQGFFDSPHTHKHLKKRYAHMRPEGS